MPNEQARFMKYPDLPANEKQRLQALHALKLLDTKAEERYDRLTRVARRSFNVPLSMLSLVDQDRQWPKSCSGQATPECNRASSFCGHAILGNEIYLIEDALADDRFKDNPLVVGDPYYRFYAGVPLRNSNGFKMGTLCILDHVPRTMQDEDLSMLRDLARMAEREFRNSELNTIDELTRISNRQGFIELAKNRIALCAREQLPLSIVFFDINNLAQINERFGNPEGDLALKAFSDLMRRSFRDSDVFARVSGNEFAVLLTNASNIFAAKIVTRFRNLIETYNREAIRGYDISFEDSIVSVTGESDYSVDELLQQADVQMYDKKLPFPGLVKPMDVAQYLE
jgi:diguanylate cyclase (GGDEF)-like protein